MPRALERGGRASPCAVAPSPPAPGIPPDSPFLRSFLVASRRGAWSLGQVLWRGTVPEASLPENLLPFGLHPPSSVLRAPPPSVLGGGARTPQAFTCGGPRGCLGSALVALPLAHDEARAYSSTLRRPRSLLPPPPRAPSRSASGRACNSKVLRLRRPSARPKGEVWRSCSLYTVQRHQAAASDR